MGSRIFRKRECEVRFNLASTFAVAEIGHRDTLPQMADSTRDSSPVTSRLTHTLVAVAGLLLMTALPLSLWGWDDWRTFFQNPARSSVIFLFVCRFGWMLAVAPPNAFNPGRQDKRYAERAFMPLIFLAGAAVMSSPYFDRRNLWTLPDDPWLRWIGLSLFAFGITIASWAQQHLGRFFSGHLTVQEGHQLITDGPFQYVRHPRYAGLILTFIGMATIFRSWFGLAGAAACAALFLVRIPREEAMLSEEFGNDWETYSKATPRLIPGLY